MGSDGIALRLVSNCANDWPANLWIRVPPANGNWVDSKGVWMRREGNVIGIEDFGKWHAIFFCRKIMNGRPRKKFSENKVRVHEPENLSPIKIRWQTGDQNESACTRESLPNEDSVVDR